LETIQSFLQASETDQANSCEGPRAMCGWSEVDYALEIGERGRGIAEGFQLGDP